MAYLMHYEATKLDYYWRDGSKYGRKDIRDEAHRTRFAEAYTTDIEDLDT